jgi:hypothetical protein
MKIYSYILIVILLFITIPFVSASFCPSGSHEMINGLCSPTLCELTKEFIYNNSMYGYSQEEFNQFYLNLRSLSFDLTEREALNYVNNFNSNCEDYCPIIDSIPYPLNNWAEFMGRQINVSNPCLGIEIILGIIGVIIIFLIFYKLM